MSMERVNQNVDRLHWFKSSYSGSDGGDCVEVAVAHVSVYVRDSKAPADGPTLRIGREEWAAFVSHASA
ncbi:MULTISPECIES: DUF397 domain-containing protein [Streptomyces]|uniref:DUF397 domain-containing protein n=1 Tax=Streptomyces TaxID=1883 RepID=UPI00099E44BB|nr:DUF397 domain-containing protein [Streptomyces hirsutus]WTD79094.1 DUF397 domain-containing protein [Streptomyces sp. NBC_01635]